MSHDLSQQLAGMISFGRRKRKKDIAIAIDIIQHLAASSDWLIVRTNEWKYREAQIRNTNQIIVAYENKIIELQRRLKTSKEACEVALDALHKLTLVRDDR